MPSEQNGSKRQNLSRKGGSSHKTVDSFCFVSLFALDIWHTICPGFFETDVMSNKL